MDCPHWSYIDNIASSCLAVYADVNKFLDNLQHIHSQSSMYKNNNDQAYLQPDAIKQNNHVVE